MCIRKVLIFLSTLCTIILCASTYDEEINCPAECHCSLDGMTVLVDCSGLEMTELPEFSDTQVRDYLKL